MAQEFTTYRERRSITTSGQDNSWDEKLDASDSSAQSTSQCDDDYFSLDEPSTPFNKILHTLPSRQSSITVTPPTLTTETNNYSKYSNSSSSISSNINSSSTKERGIRSNILHKTASFIHQYTTTNKENKKPQQQQPQQQLASYLSSLEQRQFKKFWQENDNKEIEVILTSNNN
eukprot:TRINITY_DN2410_c0_g1_i1.p1 TRINITY_DN2410_c0_g1~~TRINITY_DN2410_c0_g1_i1.p1  ORF type:complete len:186 (-),score=44.09 TRINITY_DN2410_c0_g1_i1:129-650(-)